MDHRHADARIEVFGQLLDFLNRLDTAHVHYALRHTRPESVMVDISLPGWRWEALPRTRSRWSSHSKPSATQQTTASAFARRADSSPG